MLLADAILRALEDQPGGRLAPPRVTGTEPEERLRSFLADRELLLVLDNAEHLAEAVGRLAGAHSDACTRVRILATSQRSLNTAGETVWSVPPLPVPPHGRRSCPPARCSDYPAVQLFADRAAAAGGIGEHAEDDAEAVAEICRTLDGMPLAIELAAARTRLLPPHQLLARLHDRFALLTTRSASGPARQRTLRAVVEWSYHLLTRVRAGAAAPAGRLRRRSPPRRGRAGLRHDGPTDGSPGADGITADRIVDLLAGLVDKSLIMVAAADGEARYTMLETIRAYATEQLADAGEHTALRAAHARYYADLAAASVPQLHGPDQLRWLQRLSAERANMRAAIEYASGHGDGETALRLAGALSQFWWLTGDVTDSRRLTTLALHAAEPAPSPDRAAALTFVARLDTRQEAPQSWYAFSSRRRSTTAAAATTTGQQCRPRCWPHELHRQGRRQRSRELVAQATAAAGWPGAVAQMLSGGTAGMNGDLRQAEHQLTTALATFRDLGDRWGQAESLWRLGVDWLHIRGRYEHALHALDEGVELATQLGNTEQTIHLLASAGNILVLSGDYPAARARHEEALRLAQRLSLQSEIAFISNGMGLCARRQGDYHLARAHHEHALAVYRRGRAESGLALTHAWLGYTAELEGDADQAEAHHIESLTIARKTRRPPSRSASPRGPRRCRHPARELPTLHHPPRRRHRHPRLSRRAVATRRACRRRPRGRRRPRPPRQDAFNLAFDRGAGMTLDAACTYATTRTPT